MEPTVRSTQVLKQEAEVIGLTQNEVAEYVREQQTLDREERAVWRDTQKRQVEIRMAELQAEDKKRADEIQAENQKWAEVNQIQIQMAQIEAAKEQARIEADKELTFKELVIRYNYTDDSYRKRFREVKPET